ncbi:hypothetical protein SAMD00079811_30170 [Scytonema sp. HK-05]|nr:hypothetical protein SAMD00079811_30170 [Scytonema sp. HK-05]
MNHYPVDETDIDISPFWKKGDSRLLLLRGLEAHLDNVYDMIYLNERTNHTDVAVSKLP